MPVMPSNTTPNQPLASHSSLVPVPVETQPLPRQKVEPLYQRVLGWETNASKGQDALLKEVAEYEQRLAITQLQSRQQMSSAKTPNTSLRSHTDVPYVGDACQVNINTHITRMNDISKQLHDVTSVESLLTNANRELTGFLNPRQLTTNERQSVQRAHIMQLKQQNGRWWESQVPFVEPFHVNVHDNGDE